MRIGIRNVMHHMAPTLVEMNEAEFISEVVSASGCSLHLDLHALAAISRTMRDEGMHTALSNAADSEVLYGLLYNVIDRDAA